jgi:trigger factor
VKVDLMPEFELADVSKIEVERLYSEVTDADVDEAMRRLAEQARTYSPRPEGSAAELDDTVEIDFVGRVDGEEFAGGRANGFNLVLGSGQFIAGFEEQLIGAKAGDEREVKVTFPQDYPEAQLAGKDASFAVAVKQVKAPDPIKLDDEFAKRLGVESIGQLKERVREQVKMDFNRASRLHLKRRILDALDSKHAFAVPPAMVDSEFEGIWNAVQAELKREGKTALDEGRTEDDLKKEYRGIAERRIRLGLVLARIGEQNGLDVSGEELQRAIAQRARQFPGQEQQVFEYYSKNAQAQAEIRAPLFEDKVVDFIAELADVSERKVDRETLFMDPDAAAEKLKSD